MDVYIAYWYRSNADSDLTIELRNYRTESWDVRYSARLKTIVLLLHPDAMVRFERTVRALSPQSVEWRDLDTDYSLATKFEYACNVCECAGVKRLVYVAK